MSLDRANRLRSVGAAVLALCAVVLTAAYIVQISGTSRVTAVPAKPAHESLPEIRQTEPQLLKPLTPEQAAAANSALPYVANGLERAAPFMIGSNGIDPLDRRSAVDCLTAAIYYEAAGESEQGQRAVAQVVLNRVRHPAFPAGICDVVYQGSERRTGCQFTFTCDGSLSRRPSRHSWARARRIAESAVAGEIEPAVGMATHYHTNWVAPYWAPELDKIANVGAHIFYRWQGRWGRRQMFSQRYVGEGTAAPLRLAYEQDFLAIEEHEGSEVLTVPGPPTQPELGSPAARAPALNTVPGPKPLADEISSELVLDEKEFELIDRGP